MSSLLYHRNSALWHVRRLPLLWDRLPLNIKHVVSIVYLWILRSSLCAPINGDRTRHSFLYLRGSLPCARSVNDFTMLSHHVPALPSAYLTFRKYLLRFNDSFHLLDSHFAKPVILALKYQTLDLQKRPYIDLRRRHRFPAN